MNHTINKGRITEWLHRDIAARLLIDLQEHDDQGQLIEEELLQLNDFDLLDYLDDMDEWAAAQLAWWNACVVAAGDRPAHSLIIHLQDRSNGNQRIGYATHTRQDPPWP